MSDKAKKMQKESEGKKPAIYCNHCDEFYSDVEGMREKHKKKRCRPIRGKRANEA